MECAGQHQAAAAAIEGSVIRSKQAEILNQQQFKILGVQINTHEEQLLRIRA
jgi:hypothetical protein